MKKLILLGVFACVSAGFAGDDAAVGVTFYYLPGCPVCKKNMEELKVVAEKYQDKMVASNMDATTDEQKPVMQELGFQTHGLVIRKGQEVIWKQKDHDVKVADADAFLDSFFKKS